ncbi:MAG TPA: hypothetical protein VMR70_04690 [Flavisolibacter sp.]|nr:hypothetical protein [Flavisolibacter sp.]
MKIKSVQELEMLFTDYPCLAQIANDSFTKTRYVDRMTFEALEKYELDFHPYTDIAKKCLMSDIPLLRSQKTNRFYIGFTNLGGHGAVWEIRPVGITEVKDVDYLERMYANNGQQLDWGIDLSEKYEI